ncbi:MAG: phospholipase D family protein [Alphaproteobacteria bacterium]
MAKFLNTSATNYFLEEVIKGARERLILISPFLKLNDRIRELLVDKDRLKIDVRIVYGKSELQPEEVTWLRELQFVRTSFCKNLHAKCYLNEEMCIITSLNLYEFSQVNNNEMGVLIGRDEDGELYRDAYEEAQRIIRISDEVRISMEKIPTKNEPASAKGSSPENSPTPKTKAAATESGQQPNAAAEVSKLSTSKIARKHRLNTKEFTEKLITAGFLEMREDEPHLTPKGEEIGGELRVSPRFGRYFLWPETLEI